MSNKKKTRRVRKPQRRINGKMSKKLVGLFIAVILALVGLAVRISYVNATEGQKYERIVMSQAQQQYDSKTLAFKRGDILDRNGEILATSEKVYNVILDCKVVNTVIEDDEGNEEQPYIEPTVEALTSILGIDEADIRDRLTSEETKDSQYQILVRNLSITDKKKFEEYTDLDSEENEDLSTKEYEERSNIKGVWFEENYLRVYPLGSLACDLIGFTYSDNTADWGIEGYYSSVLNGVNGRQYGYFNTDADVEQTIIDPVDGKNVISTIDANIQQIIRSAMETCLATYANGPYGAKGAENIGVIVMDPNSGEILGMDSTDWYDLNNPRDLSSFYTEEELAQMSEEDQLEALNGIWRNFCVSDSFEPGSTVKPLTIAAALETDAISEDDTYYCDGYEEIANQLIKCSIFPDYHGTQSVMDSLKNSCNDALMQIGAKVGEEELLKYQSIFNLGTKTGIDLPGENSGILHTTNSMGEAELATASFGQGFTCTMIQEAAAFSSVINGGYYYKPHVVSTITDADGSVVESIDSTVERRTVSESVSSFLREALGQVMSENGTGEDAKINGYSMGGKTGTAEKLPRSEGKYLVSFIGFAPLNDPQVVVYVVVDEPNAAKQDSSFYAQVVWKQIMSELLPYMNIFSDEAYVEESTEETYEEDIYEGTEVAAEDNDLTDPPAETYDETVENGGNSLLDEGVSNEDLDLIDG